MMTSKTDPLIEFLRGRRSWRDLPEELTLPDDLWHQMDDLWQRSIARIAEGQVSEWGGVLVLDESDNLRLVNIVQGTSRAIMLQLAVQDTRVGTFHTHPQPSGITGIAFSGVDLADAINTGELLSIVQSGEEVFATLRTDATPMFVEWKEVAMQYGFSRNEYVGQGMSEQDATRYADLDLCVAYALAFYCGRAFEPLVEEYRP